MEHSWSGSFTDKRISEDFSPSISVWNSYPVMVCPCTKCFWVPTFYFLVSGFTVSGNFTFQACITNFHLHIYSYTGISVQIRIYLGWKRLKDHFIENFGWFWNRLFLCFFKKKLFLSSFILMSEKNVLPSLPSFPKKMWHLWSALNTSSSHSLCKSILCLTGCFFFK